MLGSVPDAAADSTAPTELGALRSALEDLIASRKALATEAAALRVEVAARDQRIGVLESEIHDLRQTRRDVAKRIDGLIAQLDHMQKSAEQADSATANA